LENILTPN